MPKDNETNPRLAEALNLTSKGIPITLCSGENGKKPEGRNWGERKYTSDEIELKFGVDPDLNVGIILGDKSGIVDFEGDEPTSEDDFLELFEGEVPETPRYKSPRGIHRLFKYTSVLDQLGATKKWKSVEMRIGGGGKSAHSVSPPSKTGDFTRKWIKSPDDCDFAEIPEKVLRKICPPKEVKKKVEGDKGRPGDDFNRRGTPIQEMLLEAGWSFFGDDGDKVTYMTRPGKSSGNSGTIGYCKTEEGEDMFHVFSTNAAPFEADCTYSAFTVYAILKHGGDCSAAAADLAGLGFGKSTAGGIPSAATTIVDMLLERDGTELFHTPEGDGYATVTIDGHQEHLSISSSGLRDLMALMYYKSKGKAPNSTALKDAVQTLEGIARFDGDEDEVHIRTAKHEGSYFIDRGSSNWDAICVNSRGVEIAARPPVKFRRTKSMLELPLPESGDGLAALRELVNVSDEQFTLLVAVLMSYLRSTRPFPCTVITGEAGTAKTTLARLMKSLFDPSTCMVKGQPRDVHSLMVSAQNNWGLVLDNITSIPHPLSDALCTLATGGGFSTRQLYSDGEEFVIDVARPVILTGIGDIVTTNDLIDRSVHFELEPIANSNRRTEAAHQAEVDKQLPVILGALLDGLVGAMQAYDTVDLPGIPRLADFAVWSTAAESSFGWEKGSFMTSFNSNQTEAFTALLESKVGQAVTKLVDKVGVWKSSPTDLYHELSKDLERSAGDEWPSTVAAFGSELSRLSPVLRMAGYECIKSKKSGGRRWHLSKSCDALGA